jgi:hypothetical protein
MALQELGSYTLGGINIGLAVGIGLMNPLLLQLDLMLTGQFGLGPMLLDIQLQFSAAISAVLQMSIGISDPLSALRALIMAVAQLQASLAVALSFGLPTVSLQIGAQIAAMAALSGSLALKLGGIKALLALGLEVKIPVVKFVGQISGALNAGPAHLLSFTGTTLAVAGAEISAQFASGLGPDDPLLPTDLVDGIIIVTKDPAVFQALGLLLKTS